MGITVAEAMALQELAEVRLLAGARGLDRLIKSVSVLEVPQPLQWIKGNELFLTTFFSYPKNPDQLVSLVRDFYRQGVAALALHPGSSAALACPAGLLEAAADMGFPILGLPQSMPYMVVISTVLGSILNRQALVLQRSHEINNLLTQLVLRGEDITTVARVLADLIKRPLLILEPGGAVLAWAEAPGYEGFIACIAANDHYHDVLHILQGKRIQGELLENKAPLIFKLPSDRYSNPSMVCVPIIVGMDCYGYLVTWEFDSPLEEIDYLALNHGTTTAALEIIKQMAIDDVKRNLNDDFMGELLAGDWRSAEAVYRRAEMLGLAVADKNLVAVGAAETPFFGLPVEVSVASLKRKLVSAVLDVMKGYDPTALVYVHSHSLIIVTRIDQALPKQARGKLTAALGKLGGLLAGSGRDLVLSFGIAQTDAGLEGLPKAYRQAKESLQTGRRIYGCGHFTWYDDLGIYKLLGGLQSHDSTVLQGFCDQYLKPLIDYDQNKDAAILKTLEAYLDNKENLRLSAQELYVHPNTVKYRLDKIRAILGYDPFAKEEDRLNLFLALKAYKLLYKSP